MSSHLILYVADPAAARDFYRTVLAAEPRLDVPGMTEFELPGGAVLGLMPVEGVARLFGPDAPIVPPVAQTPRGADGTARAELYLLVDDPAAYLDRALAAGAHPLSELQARDWGHEAGYVLDADGTVLAFARPVAAG